MKTTARPAAANRFERAAPQRTRPNRSAGGFYRTADGGEGGIPGVPLGHVDEAVVAAVRMAYRVAEAQIDRSTRLAQRLRDTGDRLAGGDSVRKSVDASEQLVFRALMSGLSWLETAAAEPGSPLLRLLAAEYRLLGSVLGLSADTGAARAPGPPRDAAAPAPRPAALAIVHTGRQRLVVRVLHAELAAVAAGDKPLPVTFHRVGDAGGAQFDAALKVPQKGAPRLELATADAGSTGVWRGAVCAPDGLQVGFIEIEVG